MYWQRDQSAARRAVSAMLVLSKNREKGGMTDRGSTVRVKEDGTTERISCGEYVDDILTALCVAQARQRTSHERSQVADENVVRRETESVPSD